MTKDEALKLALESLESGKNHGIAIDVLRRVLAEQLAQQQEPFGYFRYDLRLDAWVQNRAGLTGTPFYTSPPASKPWVGLTDEEIRDWWRIENGLEDCDMAKLVDFTLAVRAVELKLREKNA